MDFKRTREHVLLPIFYHVDPSNVRNLGGSFRTSFDDHESNRPVDEVKRWKAAFVEVEFVGIDDQKMMILDLIKQEDCRVIGLWGMVVLAKPPFAAAVYREVCPEFQNGYFLQNFNEEIENQGMKSIRDEFISKY
ncbi:hypothetical protein V6N13_038460 [Hibiscus sabdariffa]